MEQYTGGIVRGGRHRARQAIHSQETGGGLRLVYYSPCGSALSSEAGIGEDARKSNGQNQFPGCGDAHPSQNL